MPVKSLSSGTSWEIPGNIDVAMMIASSAFLNRKSRRASAYAVNVPMIKVRTVVVPATTRLLTSARPKPLVEEKTDVRFFSDHGEGSRVLANWSDGRRNADTAIQ